MIYFNHSESEITSVEKSDLWCSADVKYAGNIHRGDLMKSGSKIILFVQKKESFFFIRAKKLDNGLPLTWINFYQNWLCQFREIVFDFFLDFWSPSR